MSYVHAKDYVNYKKISCEAPTLSESRKNMVYRTVHADARILGNGMAENHLDEMSFMPTSSGSKPKPKTTTKTKTKTMTNPKPKAAVINSKRPKSENPAAEEEEEEAAATTIFDTTTTTISSSASVVSVKTTTAAVETPPPLVDTTISTTAAAGDEEYVMVENNDPNPNENDYVMVVATEKSNSAAADGLSFDDDTTTTTPPPPLSESESSSSSTNFSADAGCPPPNPNIEYPEFVSIADEIAESHEEKTTTGERREMFAAMKGDSKSAKALHDSIFNNKIGVDGLTAGKWQKLQGQVFHNPSDSQLPALRPNLNVNQILDGSQSLRIGVLDIIHRKSHKGPHELWMIGVTSRGNSVSLQLTDFQPSFHVLLKAKCSSKECQDFGFGINKAIYESYGGEVTDKNKNKVPALITQVVPETRTPLIGFSEMRDDQLMRVYVKNARHTKRVVEEIERKGYRVIHSDWNIDQQFIHRTVNSRPHSQRFDEVNYDSAVRIGRWVDIPRRFLKPVTSRRRTTTQFEARVEWNRVKRHNCDNPIPILNMAYDIECISQEGYERKINKFPSADNQRDQIICISCVFYVNGYGRSGPFLRVVFCVGETDPLPNTIVYSYDTESAMMLGFRKMTVDHCDVDNVTGYNSLYFDMPYCFKRMNCIHRNKAFMYWNRFTDDPCWVPRSWDIGKQKGQEGSGGGNDQINMIGRWQVDLCPIARKQANLDDYRLKTVCNAMLKSGANKADLGYEEIAPLFHEGGKRGRAEIGFYCLIDGLLVEMLDRNLLLLSQSLEISTSTNTSLMDVVKRGEQIRVFNCVIEDVHHYQWYINKYIMSEKPCYREKVPEDWDGWSENNHLHQFLAKARDEGLVEPDTGFIPGDPRAERRDRLWKQTLKQNFLAGRPDYQEPLTPVQTREMESFFEKIMYGVKSASGSASGSGQKRSVPSSDGKRQLSLSDMFSRKPKGVKVTEKDSVPLLILPNDVIEEGEGNIDMDVDDGDDGGGGDDDDDDDTDNEDEDDDGDGDDRHRSSSSKASKKRTAAAGAGGESTLENPRKCKNIHLPLGHPDRGRRWFPGDKTLAKDDSEGGCVFRSLRGIWHRFISILDFASLYPSIIMSDDVDYSTLVWEEKYLNRPGYKYRRIAHDGWFYYLAIADPEKLSAAAHQKAVDAGQTLPEPVLRTLMPRILRRLVAARRRVKEEMSAAKKAGNSFLANVLNCIQLALKVVCNAAYGFLNTPEKMAYLSCSPLAYYICSSGRDSIRIVKYFTEQVCGGIVVYGDTDSVMGTFPEMKYEIVEGDAEATYANYVEAHQLKCEEVCQMSNEFFLEPHDLEDENTMDHGLFAGKKTYTCHIRDVPKAKEFMVKGLASKRRNYPPGLRNLCGRIQTRLLFGMLNLSKSDIRDFVTSLASYKIARKDLAISAGFKSNTVGRSLIRPHTLAKVSQRQGITFNDGDRIAYIVRPKKTGEKNYQQGEELEYADKHNIQPDVMDYFSQLKSPLEKVLQFNFDTDKLFQDWEREVRRIQQGIHSANMFAQKPRTIVNLSAIELDQIKHLEPPSPEEGDPPVAKSLCSSKYLILHVKKPKPVTGERMTQVDIADYTTIGTMNAENPDCISTQFKKGIIGGDGEKLREIGFGDVVGVIETNDSFVYLGEYWSPTILEGEV